MLTTLEFFYHSQLMPYLKIFYSCKILGISNISSWMASKFLKSAETEFLVIGLQAPLAIGKTHNPTLTIPSNTTIQPVFFCSKS